MIQIKEIRITFVCPVKGLVSLATRVEGIFGGNTVVACSTCRANHIIKTKAEDTSCRWSLAQAFNSLEAAHGQIRSFDDLEEKEEKLCS